MAEQERPLLRGRIEREENFQATRGGGSSDIRLPPRDVPKYHRRLLAELDAVASIVDSTRDEEATGVIVAAIPIDQKLGLPTDPMGDKRLGARVIGTDPETQVVLLDLSDPNAKHLRRKLEDFINDEKVSESGRKNEPFFARLEHFHVAVHAELAGPEARMLPQDDAQLRWFEVGCRGGIRARKGETLRTQAQMHRQFKVVGIIDFGLLRRICG